MRVRLKVEEILLAAMRSLLKPWSKHCLLCDILEMYSVIKIIIWKLSWLIVYSLHYEAQKREWENCMRNLTVG